MPEQERPEFVYDVRSASVESYGEPTETDLEAINARARRKLTADEIYVVRTIASHDGYDSHYTRMDPDTSLRQYARDADDARGRPIMNSHSRDLPIGRTFEGSFRNEGVPGAPDAKHHVRVAYYLARDPAGEPGPVNAVIRSIDTGSTTDHSISFGGPKTAYRCDVCGAPDMFRSETCMHYPGSMIYKDGKRTGARATATICNTGLTELSPVWRASTPGSMVVDRMLWLVERGALSPADVEEIDQLTGQRMAAAIDWERMRKRSYHVMTKTAEELAAEDQARQDALATAIEVTAEADPPANGVQTGEPPAEARIDPNEPWQVRAARDLNIADEASFRAVAQQAEDGRAYRADLVALAHKAGVAAEGTAYDRAVHDKMLAGLTTGELRGQLEARTRRAREVFAKDIPGDSPENEALRGELAKRYGGRQTQPSAGALGDTGNLETKERTDPVRPTPGAYRMPK